MDILASVNTSCLHCDDVHTVDEQGPKGNFDLCSTGGIPLNIAVSSSQSIEVYCDGSEDNIQECDIDRLSSTCSTGIIAGVNCTGIYMNVYVFVCMYLCIYMHVCMYVCISRHLTYG